MATCNPSLQPLLFKTLGKIVNVLIRHDLAQVQELQVVIQVNGCRPAHKDRLHKEIVRCARHTSQAQMSESLVLFSTAYSINPIANHVSIPQAHLAHHGLCQGPRS